MPMPIQEKTLYDLFWAYEIDKLSISVTKILTMLIKKICIFQRATSPT